MHSHREGIAASNHGIAREPADQLAMNNGRRARRHDHAAVCVCAKAVTALSISSTLRATIALTPTPRNCPTACASGGEARVPNNRRAGDECRDLFDYSTVTPQFIISRWTHVGITTYGELIVVEAEQGAIVDDAITGTDNRHGAIARLWRQVSLGPAPEPARSTRPEPLPLRRSGRQASEMACAGA